MTSCVGSDDAEVTQQIPATPADGEACIDIWWLINDGGLTMLLPYLIKKSRSSPFAKHKLRLMVINEDIQGSESRTISREEALQTKAHLLAKLRIKAEIKVVDAKLEAPPSEEYAKRYASLGFSMENDDSERGTLGGEDEEAAASTTTDKGEEGKNAKKATRTNHYVRLSEIIHQHSSKSSLVFVSLPKRFPTIRTARCVLSAVVSLRWITTTLYLPRRDLHSCSPIHRYMSWLEMISGPCPATGKPMPPTVMIRGCEDQPALTFES